MKNFIVYLNQIISKIVIKMSIQNKVIGEFDPAPFSIQIVIQHEAWHKFFSHLWSYSTSGSIIALSRETMGLRKMLL